MNTKSKFEKLLNNNNLVMPIRVAIGKKCKTTIFHFIVGVPMLPDEMYYVGRANLHVVTRIKMDPAALSKERAEICTATILELTKVKKADELPNLHGSTT